MNATFDIRTTLVEEIGNGEYRLQWPARNGPGDSEDTTRGPIRVFAGEAPDSIDRTSAVAQTSGSAVTVSLPPVPRRYFSLVAEGTSPFPVAARAVKLDGVSNFRDLGGYVASEPGICGRSVKWGRLFRSAHFAQLSTAGLRRLHDLGVGLVVDFRTAHERQRHPNRFGNADAPQVRELDIDPGSGQGFAQAVDGDQMSEASLRAAMITVNRNLVRDHAAAYATMFDALLGGRGASVIQCTSGKDRTGLGSALILAALGVDRETILHDYVLTNRYLDLDRTFARAVEDMGHFGSDRITAEMLRPLYETRPEYLAAALDEIDENFDGPPAYLRHALGMTDERIGHFRALYLE